MRARRAGNAAARLHHPLRRQNARAGRRGPGCVGHGGIVPYAARSPVRRLRRRARPKRLYELIPDWAIDGAVGRTATEEWHTEERRKDEWFSVPSVRPC